jgi:hypothetical protein
MKLAGHRAAQQPQRVIVVHWHAPWIFTPRIAGGLPVGGYLPNYSLISTPIDNFQFSCKILILCIFIVGKFGGKISGRTSIWAFAQIQR